MVHNIVDCDGQAIFAGACERIDLGLERRKSPCVLDDKLSIEIDAGRMRHGAKTQHHSLRKDMVGDDDLPFIPDPPDVVAKFRPLVQIVVGSRNRHRDRLLQRVPKPFLCKSRAVIKLKVPDPV